MPSIAHPKRIVIPLPAPDITPPKTAHSNKSDHANGDINETSIGRTSIIINDANEYTVTAKIE